MEPSEWEQWPHFTMTTPEGVAVHYVDVGPRDGLPIVMLHGWPDLWFGWRYQIKALSPTYRLIVPDVRGFGQSGKPKELEAYGTKHITDDCVALLDELKIDKAVFIGHDWGGKMVWRMCLYHPERVIAVCGVCTPYMPPRKTYVPLEAFTAVVPQFKYQEFLADTAKSGPALDASPRRLFTAIFRKRSEQGPPKTAIALKDWLKAVDSDLDHHIFRERSSLLSEAELQFYIDQYTESKFASACQTYATSKIDYDSELDLPETIEHRALFIGAADDPVLKPEMAVGMPKLMSNVEMKLVEDACHWVLFEQPEAVNKLLIEWLAKIAESP